MFGRRKPPPDALPRLADSFYDLLPLLRPEVVRFPGLGDALRLHAMPDTYVLVAYVGGDWTLGDVFIDAATGEPATDAFGQRLMRDSIRALPIPDPRDLDAIVPVVVEHLAIKWTTHLQLAGSSENEHTEFAKEAVASLQARFDDPRPPLHP